MIELRLATVLATNRQHWTQESAAQELAALIRETDTLAGEERFSAAHTRWVMRTLRLLEQVSGRASRYYLSFAALDWVESGAFFVGGPGDPHGVWYPNEAIERRHQRAYREQLDSAKGIPPGRP